MSGNRRSSSHRGPSRATILVGSSGGRPWSTTAATQARVARPCGRLVALGCRPWTVDAPGHQDRPRLHWIPCGRPPEPLVFGVGTHPQSRTAWPTATPGAYPLGGAPAPFLASAPHRRRLWYRARWKSVRRWAMWRRFLWVWSTPLDGGLLGRHGYLREEFADALPGGDQCRSL